MNSPTGLSTKQRLFIISSLIIGSIMLSVSLSVLSSGGRPPQARDSLPLVESQAGSLQFINTEKTELGFVSRMRNISKKTITALAVSLCDVPLFSTDYSIGDDSIAPGKTLDINLSIQAVKNNCGDATAPIITILAVVFDDRSTEGEFAWAKGILDNRRGEKIQLKRINRLLTQAANWTNTYEATGIERLKSEIAALPVDEGELPSVRGGLASAKDRVMYMLGELEQWHSRKRGIQSKSGSDAQLRAELAGISNLREGFAKLITLNEKWISKY